MRRACGRLRLVYVDCSCRARVRYRFVFSHADYQDDQAMTKFEVAAADTRDPAKCPAIVMATRSLCELVRREPCDVETAQRVLRGEER